jgi:GGDEF domain-containing protein
MQEQRSASRVGEIEIHHSRGGVPIPVARSGGEGPGGAPARLLWALSQARTVGSGLVVLCVECDDFKQLDAAPDRHALESRLQEIARCLEHHASGGDLVRTGPDRFVLLLGPPADPSDAEMVAGSIVQELAHPDHPGVSVGVALFPEHGDDPASLLAKAESAAQRASEQGGSTYQLASSH